MKADPSAGLEALLAAVAKKAAREVLDEIGPAEAPPALVDRQGLARALSVSASMVDRLRREPGFPEVRLVDAPRFRVADVVRWLEARQAGGGQPGPRLVSGPGANDSGEGAA